MCNAMHARKTQTKTCTKARACARGCVHMGVHMGVYLGSRWVLEAPMQIGPCARTGMQACEYWHTCMHMQLRIKRHQDGLL